MNKTRAALIAASLLLLPCCGGTVDIDTIVFRHVPREEVEATQPKPSLWIDTHINQPGLFGGKVRSARPYGVRLDYTDETFTYEGLDVTALEVTYAGGEVEPEAAALTFPLAFRFHPYEAVNSTRDGVVRTQLSVLSAEVKSVITRDEDFRIVLSGHFRKKGDVQVPFEIVQQFTKVHDKRTVKVLELYADV